MPRLARPVLIDEAGYICTGFGHLHRRYWTARLCGWLYRALRGNVQEIRW